MPSSKNQDYVVEKILSKRTDGKGRVSYLIQWRGYSAKDNTWEPDTHVTNCPDMVQAFENEEAKKNKSDASQRRTSGRAARTSPSPIKIERRGRPSLARKRASNNKTSYVEVDDDDDTDYNGSKSAKPVLSKRLRKNTSDTDTTPSDDSHDSEVLDVAKLDQILDVRRDKKSNTIEYQIQVKKNKNSVWIKSERLTEDYSQQVVDFLEEKFV